MGYKDQRPNQCVVPMGEQYLTRVFYTGESPPVPWEGPGGTWPSLAVCPIGSARDSHVFGKGLSPFRAHGLARLCCIVLFSWGL